MDIKKKFTIDIGIIGIRNLLVTFSGMLLIPILTKTLGPHDYGIWVQITVTIGMIDSLASLGLPYAMVRFLAGENKLELIQEGLFSTVAIVFLNGVAASFVLAIITKYYAGLFIEINGIITIIALVIPIWCANGVLFDFFRATRQMQKILIFTALQSFGDIGLVAYLLLFCNYGLYAAVISLLVVRAILFLIMGYSIISKIGIKLPDFSRIREYLAFSMPTIPSNMSSWIVNSSDRFIIGFFLGATSVGYYFPGVAIGNIISIFVSPLSFVLPAALSKLYDESNIEEVRMHLHYSLKYFFILAIPSVFGLSLLSKQLLTNFSTPEIAANGYLVTPFIAITALVLGAYSTFSQILVIARKTKILCPIWIIAAISNLGLNFILVPHVGIIGAAATTLITFSLAFIFTIYYSTKYLKFDICFDSILKSIFSSIVMSLIIIKWNPIGMLDIIIVICVSSVVYASILFMIGGFNRNEIRFFRESLRM